MKHTVIFLLICLTVFSVHAQYNIPNTNMWYNNQYVGVNNNNPQYTLDVTGYGSSTGQVIRNPWSPGSDLVLQSIIPQSDGTQRVFHLIGMYPGFDPSAIYIGGYNAGEANPFVPTNATKVLVGNPYYHNTYMSIGFMAGGGVGINTQNYNGYQFNVNGSARFNRVVVNTTGADYVFDSSYHLRPLSAVGRYIAQYHHLPEVASADSMEKEGLDVGDNQTTLLKKIEELTLYMLQQQKEIDELKEENRRLAAKVK